MGKSWDRTQEQDDFLEIRRSLYVQASLKGRVEPFLATLYEDWFIRWPEREALFGVFTTADPPMTSEQRKLWGEAILKRKEQLYNFMRWHGDGTNTSNRKNSRKPKAVVLSKLLQPTKRTRRPQLIEVYMKTYFVSKISAPLSQALEESKPATVETPDQFSARRLSHQRAIAQQLYAQETPEVRLEIEDKRNNMPKKSGKRKGKGKKQNESQDDQTNNHSEPEDASNGELTPHTMQKNIDTLGPLLVKLMTELSDQTGWSFTVLMGGLVEDGTLRSASIHHGLTAAGNTFADATIDYAEKIMGPWGEFLVRKYPPALQREREHAFAAFQEKLDACATSVPQPIQAQDPINAGLIVLDGTNNKYPPVNLGPRARLSSPLASPNDFSSSAPSSPPTVQRTPVNLGPWGWDDAQETTTVQASSTAVSAIERTGWPELFHIPDISSIQPSPPRHARIQHVAGASSSSYQDVAWDMPPLPLGNLENTGASMVLDNFMWSSSPTRQFDSRADGPSSGGFSYTDLPMYFPMSSTSTSFQLPLAPTSLFSTPTSPHDNAAPIIPSFPSAATSVTTHAQYNPAIAPAQPPTVAPNVTPAVAPNVTPAVAPNVTPAVAPTITPAVAPTVTPAVAPTVTPTVTPAAAPAIAPTVTPAVTPATAPAVVSAVAHVELIVMPPPEPTAAAHPKKSTTTRGRKSTGTEIGKKSKAGGKGTLNSTKHVSQENVVIAPDPQPRPKPRPMGRKRKRTDNQDASETENGVPQETAIERDETVAAATNLGEQHPLQVQQNVQEQPIAQRESRQRKQSAKAGVVLMWEKEEEAKRARKKAKGSK